MDVILYSFHQVVEVYLYVQINVLKFAKIDPKSRLKIEVKTIIFLLFYEKTPIFLSWHIACTPPCLGSEFTIIYN